MRRFFIVVLAWLVVGFSPLVSADAKVGTLIYLQGAAWVYQDGARTPVAQGASVTEGARIVTGENALMQIRFVDDALLMVRANTDLSVQVYAFDRNRPAANRIRLFVRQGQVRWITGRAGQLNKKGFRLNTPVAAIGIRGTDFVTRAAVDGATSVQLLSGAVVVSPLGEGCAVNGFGPCQTPLAVSLDEQRKGWVVEIRKSQPKPILKKGTLTSSAAAENGALNTPAEQPLPPFKTVAGREALKENAPLQWGRYAQTPLPAWPDAQALLQKGLSPRVVTDHLVLMGQDDFTGYPRGQATMALEAAEAYRFANGQAHPVGVLDGRLQLDFDRKRFSTAIELEGAGALQAEGALRNDGLYFSDEGNMQVKGAVSADGNHSAYLFQARSQADLAPVEGATYWRAR